MPQINNITKLHESIFILHKCQKTVERIYEAISNYQEKGPIYSMHHFTQNLGYYQIMETVSFLDEYKKGFVEAHVEPEYRDRVKAVRKILKPLISKINEWKDLERFRHNIVAHGWRDEKRGKILVVPFRQPYDVPHTGFEFQYLNDLLRYSYEVIHQEFEQELNEIIFMVYRGTRSATKEPRKKLTLSKANNNIKQLVKEINQLLEQVGKDYDVKLTTYELPTKKKSKL